MRNLRAIVGSFIFFIVLATTAQVQAQILFVSGSASGNASDQVLITRLEQQGRQVQVIDDDVITSGAESGFDLVLISSTVASGKVGTKLTGITVPIINWEAFLFDDLGMTGNQSGTDFGSNLDQTQIEVTNNSHPLAAGLSGLTTVTSSPHKMYWGQPGASAINIAHVAGDSSRSTVFAYEAGALLANNQVAQSRHVGLFMGTDAPADFTAEALQLFDAAIFWVSNKAPVVDAGADLFAQVGVPVALSGSVVDDGLALPLSVSWGVLSGVLYTDATDPNTNVTFDTEGVYTLELSADDTEFFVSDTVTVTVTNDPPPKSILFVSGSAAGTVSDQVLIARLEQQGHQVQVIDDDVITSGAESGFDLVLISSSVISGNVGTKLTGITVPVINWEAILFDDLGMSGDQSGNFGSNVDETQIDVINSSHPLSAGLSGLTTVTSSPQRMYWGQPGANAINIAHIAGDPSRSTVFAYEAGALLANNLPAQSRLVGLFMDGDAPAALTAEALQLFDAAIFWVLNPANQTPSVDAGVDFDAFVGESVSLSGAVLDDGIAQPLTIGWSVTNGSATFIDNTDVTTGVTFDTAGVYILELAADDTEFFVSDTVTVTVTVAVNEAPVVDAGADFSALVGVPVALSGSVVDDGITLPLSVSWGALSGVLYTDATDPTTNVTFDTAGIYTLELSADDTEFFVSDTVTVTVTVPVNEAPVVDAGMDLSVLVGVSVALSGSVMDDGITLPLSVSWGALSGVLYTDATDPTTNVTFDTAGVYTLELAADDTEFFVNDTVAVTVTVPVNETPVVDAGTDLSVLVGVPVALSGSVVDDGVTLPLSVSWGALSGVLYTDATDPTTNVTFDTAGVYTLELSADDTEFFVSDTVTVTVTVPVNETPVVDAGADFTVPIGMPVALSGSVMDDGVTLPLSVSWGALSGVLYTDATDPTTNVTFDTAGVYTLELSADDTEFFVNDTVTVTVTDPSAKSILFVSGSATGSTSDQVLITRLEQQGHQVQVIDDDVLASGAESGFDLVLVSSTVISGKVGTKLTSIVVPLVSWEAFIFDDLGMSGDQSGDFGSNLDQTQIEVINSSHSLSAGLSGLTTVTSSPQRVYWGQPGANAINIAHVVGDASRSTVFAYEAGALLVNNLVAQSRLVGLYMDGDAPAVLTAEALQLFDAAIFWVLNPVNQAPSVDAGFDLDVLVGESVSLSGVVIDDGIAQPLTIGWSVTNGSATFVDNTDVTTDVTFDTAGVYTLELAADDTEFFVSDTIMVTVTEPVNETPVVDAGTDFTVQVGVPVALSGSVVDDGVTLPLSMGWGALSGVLYTDATDPTTNVTFDTEGVYTLELSVNDTEFFVSDMVTVTVTNNPPPKSVLFVSGSAAGTVSDQVLITRLEQQGHQVQVIDDDVITSGAENGFDLVLISSSVVSGKVGTTLTGITVPVINWEAFLFDDLGMSGDQSGDFGSNLDETQIDVINSSHPLSAGLSGLTTVTSSPQRMYWGQPGANAINIAHIAGDPSRSTVFAYETGALMVNNLVAQARHVGLYMDGDAPAVLTAEALQLFDAAIFWVLNPVNQAPSVDAGFDLDVLVGESVSLSGVVIDDGIAQPLTIGWSVTNGSATFEDSTDVTTAVVFNSAGVYELELAADDTEFFVSDTIMVTVTVPVNGAPVVDAGADFTVPIGMPIALSGSVVDDGVTLPLSVSWGALSGVLYTDATDPTTNVTFDTEGVYTLELSADDTEFFVSDTITVTVVDGPPPKSILFVSGSAAGTVSDQVLITRLEQQGHQVQVIDDDVITSGAESGFDLVLISSSVSSSKVGNKLTGIAVPIINWEAFLFDDLGMTGGQSGVDFGSNLDETQIDVINSSHSLSAGLSGLTTVTSSPQRMYWGQPGANAINIAHIAGDPSRSTVFAYETGVLMVNNLPAQSRRIGLFMDGDAPAALTAEALQLFDVAIFWVLFNQAPVVDAGTDFSAVVGVPEPLSGSVMDDGLVLPLSVNWGAMSGVLYTDATDPTTNVTFDTAGVYTLELSADDTEFFVSDTVTVTVTDSSPIKSILFVSGSAAGNASDQILIARLEQQGHQVQVVDDDVVTSSLAVDSDLVLISSSVSSGKVGNKLTGVAVPVINWEAFIFDDLGMTGDQSGVDFGSNLNETQIEVTNNSHPLAAGLSGLTAVTNISHKTHWGMPGANAINIAHIAGDPSRSTVFAYEAGDILENNMVALSRRVGLYMGKDASVDSTVEALQLFDAAVSWALDAPVLNTVKIMPLGDSITKGKDGHWSYRHTLSDSLLAQQCVFDFVGSQNGPDTGEGGTGAFDRDHEGHSGFRADEVEANIAGWIADNQADWALIHLGTNDILQAQSVQAAAQNIGDIIDILRAQNPSIGILLAQIIPNHAFNDAEVVLLNQEIATLVANKTQPGVSPVLLIDQHTGYDSSVLNYDSVHPNAAGEDFMANMWMQSLLPELQGQGFCN